jgi:hypothetical protein
VIILSDGVIIAVTAWTAVSAERTRGFAIFVRERIRFAPVAVGAPTVRIFRVVMIAAMARTVVTAECNTYMRAIAECAEEITTFARVAAGVRIVTRQSDGVMTAVTA